MRGTLNCPTCKQWCYADSIHTCSPPPPMRLQEILEAFYKMEIDVLLRSLWDDGWRVRVPAYDFKSLTPYSFEAETLEECRAWLEKNLRDLK